MLPLLFARKTVTELVLTSFFLGTFLGVGTTMVIMNHFYVPNKKTVALHLETTKGTFKFISPLETCRQLESVTNIGYVSITNIHFKHYVKD